MESSVEDVANVLLQLAARTQDKAGEAEALRRQTEQAHHELTSAWEGSRHDASYTGRAYCVTAVADIEDGMARLHRAAEIMTSAAHRM